MAENVDVGVFAEEVAQLAVAMEEDRGTENETLATITEGAASILPEAESASIVYRAADGVLGARSMFGAMCQSVMDLQNEVREGPCLDAVNRLDQVRAGDLSTETQWPLFAARALQLGVASILSTPLVLDNKVYGSLSLFSKHPNAFDADCETLAEIFAAHAAIALSGASLRTQMTDALSNRDVIGQAKGIVMERYGLGPDAAFAFLVRMSQSTQQKLREVCRRLAETGELPDVAPTRAP